MAAAAGRVLLLAREHRGDGLIATLRMRPLGGQLVATLFQPRVECSQIGDVSCGKNSHSRNVPTGFSTCPFSQPEAGVQALGENS